MNAHDDILRGIKNSFGLFPQQTKILKALEATVSSRAHQQHHCVFGPPGVGKSRLLRHFLRLHPPVVLAEVTHVPVLLVPIPANCSVKKLAGEMLQRMGSDYWNKGDELDRTFQLKTLMRACQVRTVLLDETNHLVDRGQAATHYFVADWIKVLADETEASFVLAGTSKSSRLLEVNEQLRSRFRSRFDLMPFAMTSREESQEWIRVLRTFQSLLSPLDLIDLTDAKTATALLFATGGRLRELKQLLVHVVEIAEASPELTLDLSVFSRAFREAIWKAPPARNPFERDFNCKPLIARGEPFAEGMH